MKGLLLSAVLPNGSIDKESEEAMEVATFIVDKGPCGNFPETRWKKFFNQLVFSFKNLEPPRLSKFVKLVSIESSEKIK
jgi:hypothetical protein